MVDLELNPRLNRRRVLARGLALALSAGPGAALISSCDGMMGDDDGEMGRRPDWMMGGGQMMDAGMMEDMRVIRDLLANHEQIRRDVENVATGIRARTTSRDPEIAGWIRTHVRQMQERIEQGDPIRHMDPLFREIFEHHEAVEMDIEQTRDGVLVVETSIDPQVELLIRQHAHRAVSEFVAEGMARAMRPTPLPPGYRESG